MKLSLQQLPKEKSLFAYHICFTLLKTQETLCLVSFSAPKPEKIYPPPIFFAQNAAPGGRKFIPSHLPCIFATFPCIFGVCLCFPSAVLAPRGMVRVQFFCPIRLASPLLASSQIHRIDTKGGSQTPPLPGGAL